MYCLRLFVVQTDFLVIEIIDDDRFARLAAAVRESVAAPGKD